MKQFTISFINKIKIFKDSNNPAFCINDVFYSYSELFNLVEQVTALLKNINDEVFGLYATDDIRTYATILSLWFQGKSYVPLNPNQPSERHTEIISNIGIKYIISSDESFTISKEKVTIIYSVNCSHTCIINSKVQNIKEVCDEKLAYILFTSGSTGKQKGVMISRNNLAAFIDSMEKININITIQDKCLQPFDLTFDFSISCFVIPLLKGACIFTIPNNHVKFTYIANLIEKYNLTVLQMVPSMIRNLIPYLNELDLKSIRYNIFCGEALSAKLIKIWHSKNPLMVSYNMYGPTENTVFCTYYIIDRNNIDNLHEKNDVVTIGKTFYNSRFTLLDNENTPICKENHAGELCLCGPQLTPGYWNNEPENREKFLIIGDERYYKTGDICTLSLNNNLMFISRKDFQIKINGYRVELGEIENLYTSISKGNFCVVIPYYNQNGNMELSIIIEGDEYDYNKHKEYLSSRLPKYMIPSKWYFLKSIPLNESGKIDRNKIIKSLNL